MKLKVSNKVGFLAFVAVSAGIIGFFGARYVTSFRVAADRLCDNIQCVNLRADGARPDTLAVPVGSYVQFNSADGQMHSLSLGKGGDAHGHSGPFTSGNFAADEAWKVQFKEPGTFHFHDHYNPGLNVLIVVYEAGGDHTIKR